MQSNSTSTARLWRQGDIIIQECPALPEGRTVRKGRMIAKGEATGHSHRIAGEGGAALFDPPAGETVPRPGLMYLVVPSGSRVAVVHPEHATVELDAGCYRVWRQREFDVFRQQWRIAGD
jgi:hypothetical protein